MNFFHRHNLHPPPVGPDTEVEHLTFLALCAPQPHAGDAHAELIRRGGKGEEDAIEQLEVRRAVLKNLNNERRPA
jgi:hypothetical protein